MDRSLRLSLFAILFLLTVTGPSGHVAGAQAKDASGFFRPDVLYFAAGAGKIIHLRNGVGPVFEITAIRADHWGASISYRGAYYTAEALPSGYNGPYFNFGANYPEDEVHSVSLHLLREWRPGRSAVSFALEAGLAGIGFKTWSFTPLPSGQKGWSYESVANWETVPGLSARGRIRIPVKKIAGLELATAGHLNRRKSMLSVEVLLSFGHKRGGRSS